MLLNATCIVQIINVGIAYFLLDTFLLKHVADTVLEDIHQDTLLRTQVEREQALVQEKETIKIRSWHVMRKRFQEGSPRVVSTTPSSLPTLDKETLEENLSKKEREKYVHDVLTFLKNKVDHVH